MLRMLGLCCVLAVSLGCIDTAPLDAAWELRQRFRYQIDTVDTWRILPETGMVSGDCDDFARTLQEKYNKMGVSSTLWYVDTKGDGRADHMALSYFCGLELCIVDNNGTVKREAFYPHKLLGKVPYSHIKIKGR